MEELRLGQELQLLLKIPPISKKVDTVDSPPRTSRTIPNELPERSSNNSVNSGNYTDVNRSASNNEYNVKVKASGVEVKKKEKQQEVSSSLQHHNNKLTSNSSSMPTVAATRKGQQYQSIQPSENSTKVLKERTELKRPIGQQQQQQQQPQPPLQGNKNETKPAVKSIPVQENHQPATVNRNTIPSATSATTSTTTHVSSSTVSSETLVQLLQRPECPADLRQETDMLVDHAYRERNGATPSQSLKKILSAHGIEILSKRSSKFPKAKFICNSCNYHLDSIYACVHHILGPRHSAFEFMKKLEYTLERIPQPSRSHCMSVGRFLDSIMEQYAISEAEVARRKEYVARLNEDLKAANIGCTLTLFGSSYSSLGFKDSDININISMNTSNDNSAEVKPSAADNFEILQKLFLFFQHHPSSLEVKKMVSSKSATIYLIERESLSEVILSMNNNAGVETARLFAEYVKISPLVRPLVIAFRVWAKFCEIDNQDKGSLPPHAFTVMVLYYMQQVNILPNLHHIRFLSKEEPDDDKYRDYASSQESRRYWTPSVQKLPGLVWLEMLRFWALEFNYRELVVSISQQVVYRSDKYWNRKLSVEDPVIPKSNLSRSMSNNRMCEYILERFLFTYLYFGLPRTIRGPLYDGIVSMENEEKCQFQVFHRVLALSKTNNSNTSNSVNKHLEKITNPKWDPISLIEEVQNTKHNNFKNFPTPELASIKVRMCNFIGNDNERKTYVLVDDAKVFETMFPESLLEYNFDKKLLQNGVKPPVICKSCGGEGHLKSDCPDEILPGIKPVMNATPDFLRLLNDVLLENYEEESLNAHDAEIRRKIIEQLQEVLLPLYPDLELGMFGSTYNGFGNHSSDIDICLTFRNGPSSQTEGVNGINILRTIEEKLKTVKFLQEVIAIPSAKVPIIKFRHKEYDLEGDISLYNTLAMHNTHLLRTYAEEVDVRVKIIGCFVKKLTKLCDISDASRGSLSSYGYVLMIIHYFQHLPIPVLPVLQELCRDTLQPIIVDGCDVQYFKDIKNLHHVWPLYGRNRQSLSELWLGFLNYYTETFNFDENVVSISQFAPLTRLSKLWLTDAIAIEDPFEKNHNLGSGLSRRMSVHILKTFQHLREVFHTSYDSSVLKKHMNWLDFFTDPKLISVASPPLERVCRICKKIGHFARNCVAPTLVDLVNETVKSKNREKSNRRPTKTTALTEINNTLQSNQKIGEETGQKQNESSRDQNENVHNNNKQPSPDGNAHVLQKLAGSQQVSDRPNFTLPNEDEFPQFFEVKDAQRDEDEVLFQMTTRRLNQSPGVEFLLPDEQPPEQKQQQRQHVPQRTAMGNFGNMYMPFHDPSVSYHQHFPQNMPHLFHRFHPMDSAVAGLHNGMITPSYNTSMIMRTDPPPGMMQHPQQHMNLQFVGSPFQNSMQPQQPFTTPNTNNNNTSSDMNINGNSVGGESSNNSSPTTVSAPPPGFGPPGFAIPTQQQHNQQQQASPPSSAALFNHQQQSIQSHHFQPQYIHPYHHAAMNIPNMGLPPYPANSGMYHPIPHQGTIAYPNPHVHPLSHVQMFSQNHMGPPQIMQQQQVMSETPITSTASIMNGNNNNDNVMMNDSPLNISSPQQQQQQQPQNPSINNDFNGLFQSSVGDNICLPPHSSPQQPQLHHQLTFSSLAQQMSMSQFPRINDNNN